MPPSSMASRASGGKAGRPPSRSRRTIAGRSSGRLPGQPGGRALAEPGPAHVAPERGDREGRRQVGVVGPDHHVRVLVLGREQQRLARLEHARRAPLERGRCEHVDLVLAEPAREVAPAGGGGRAPRQRQPGLRERQRGRRGCSTTATSPGSVSNSAREVVALDLERGQHGGRLLGLRRLVAGGEGERSRLDPGHAGNSRRARRGRPRAGCVRLFECQNNATRLMDEVRHAFRLSGQASDTMDQAAADFLGVHRNRRAAARHPRDERRDERGRAGPRRAPEPGRGHRRAGPARAGGLCAPRARRRAIAGACSWR